MQPWEIIQSSQVLEGVYDRERILALLSDLPVEQFNRFCREYLHLLHYYESNKDVWITDHRPIIAAHADHFFKLPEVDFDSPPPLKIE